MVHVSLVMTWILFLAMFPMAFLWLRRAYRIIVKKDYSEVALKRGEPPENEQYFPGGPFRFYFDVVDVTHLKMTFERPDQTRSFRRSGAVERVPGQLIMQQAIKCPVFGEELHRYRRVWVGRLIGSLGGRLHRHLFYR